jgi:hypothetical protein
METDAFAVHIVALAEGGWTGSAQQLFGTYHGRLDRGTDTVWPKSAQGVGIRMGRIAGVLRKSGVTATKRRTERSVEWTLTKA